MMAVRRIPVAETITGSTATGRVTSTLAVCAFAGRRAGVLRGFFIGIQQRGMHNQTLPGPARSPSKAGIALTAEKSRNAAPFPASTHVPIQQE
jgi:hypothetical protein